ncbi:MAG: histone acetyltransferase HPA2 [Pseudomonas sp. 34-62-33]|nr:MAG: histone acetyltransferase HPA2 [Pseudomonas sp. 34-62-33]
MNDKNAPVELIDTPAALELTAIEFESPGRFAVHNPESVTADAAQWEPAPFTLGQHEHLERFSKPQEARAHVLALIQQAQRNLCLYTDDLEPWLYHHSRRRLSSNLHIRKLNPDHANEESAFLIADDRGLLLRPELNQQSGYTLYNDPARVRQRQTQFDQAWDTSITDPDLRSFLL